MSDPVPSSPSAANPVERVCGALAKVALVAMLLVIGAELVMRNTLHDSWEGTDEFGSYLLVAVTFLSMATSLAHGGFHELLLVKGRLGPRPRACLEATLQAICLVCAAVLTWYFVRTVYTTWSADERSLTGLMVPLWIPRVAMPVGTAALCITLVLDIRRTLRAAWAPQAR